MHRLIFLILSLAISFSTNAQTDDNGKSILVVSTEPGFLRPFIETTIKELKNVALDSIYFKEVYSLNNYEEDREIRSTVTKIIWDQTNAQDLISTKPITKEDIKTQEEIIKKLTSYDYFLTVKTNTLGELIEFQFQLFETEEIKAEYGKKTYLKRVLVDNVLAVENFFINPKDSQYLVEIKNSIYRLFEGSNQRPISRLKIYDQDVKNNDVILVPIETPILLDASASYDIDTEKISYDWKSLPKPNENFQTFDKIDFNIGSSQQNITIDKDGIYLVQFMVNDGVLNSKELNFYLKTIEKKEPIKFKWTETTNYSYSSLKYPEPKYMQKASYYINSKKNDSAKLIITNKEIGNKYVKKIHEKNIINYDIIDSVYIDRDQTKFTKEISIKSNFDNYPNDSLNVFYAYNINKDSILSEPEILKHKYIHRGVGSFGTILSSTSIEGHDFRFITEEGDSIYKRSDSWAVILEGSIHLTPRIELGGSFPIYSKGRAEVDEFSIKPHSSLSLFANYFIIPKSNTSRFELFVGLGGGVSNYKIENIEDSFEIVYLQELRFGAQSELLIFDKFSMTWGIRYMLGRYNKSIFKDLTYINMATFFKFRL